MKRKIMLRDVRSFWETSPLCVKEIPHEPGSKEFFLHYDRLREENEPAEFSRNLHEYRNFKGKRVLDVGCGNGYVLSRYAMEGAHAFGLDLTEKAVEISKKRFHLMGLRGMFIQGNAETMPFKDDSFDCVCSMGVLHHTPDTEKAIEDVRRVLKPNGRVILMFYHKHSVFNMLTLPLRRVLNPGNWFKSHQTMLNDVDGYGNPKGAAYSKALMRRLLDGKFHDIEMFCGWVTQEMFWPLGRLVPKRLLDATARRWGFFLYIKGWK